MSESKKTVLFIAAVIVGMIVIVVSVGLATTPHGPPEMRTDRIGWVKVTYDPTTSHGGYNVAFTNGRDWTNNLTAEHRHDVIIVRDAPRDDMWISYRRRADLKGRYVITIHVPRDYNVGDDPKWR